MTMLRTILREHCVSIHGRDRWTHYIASHCKAYGSCFAHPMLTSMNPRHSRAFVAPLSQARHLDCQRVVR